LVSVGIGFIVVLRSSIRTQGCVRSQEGLDHSRQIHSCASAAGAPRLIAQQLLLAFDAPSITTEFMTLRTTRWQGTAMATGLFAQARATALAEPGEPTLAASSE